MTRAYNVVSNTKNMAEREWLKLRQQGIGGSDAGAIVGVNKYKTAFTLYMDKISEIEDVGEQSEAAYWGHIQEETVAKEFEKRTGKKVRRRNQLLQSKENPFMFANLDREIVGESAFLECKTASEYKLHEWESEEIPDSYLVQVQHYLAVTGYEKAYIACLIGGNKYVWKEVARDDEAINLIIEAEKDFWENNILKKIPPAIDGSSAAEEYIKEKYKKAEPGKEIDLDSEINKKINNYIQINDTIKTLTEQKKAIENEIKDELKDAETGYAEGYKVTWKEVSSNRVDSKLLKEKYPDIYKAVIKESCSRRFGIKEEK